MKKQIDSLFSRAKLKIYQITSNSQNTNQSINVNVMLDHDNELSNITKEIIRMSNKNIKSFRMITDYLKSIDKNKLNDFEKDLMTTWLRKVVASNHISYAKRYLSENRFKLIMIDTSFYDQPYGSWINNPDFLKVVDFDSKLATHLRRSGEKAPVLRIFYVPDGKFILNTIDYISKSVIKQVGGNITCCVARADYIALIDGELVCDIFLIPKRLVCCIEKPYWQFQLFQDSNHIKRYIEKVNTIIESDYSIVISQKNLSQIKTLLEELAKL